MQSRTRWFLIVFLSLLLISLTATLVAANGGDDPEDDDTGVKFLRDKAQTVTLPQGETTVPFTAKVINGSSIEQDIYLDLVWLIDANGVPAPADVLADDLPKQSPESIPTGGTVTFVLTFTRVATETYTGQLVAYGGGDGSLDRLDFTLVITPEKSFTPPPSVLSVMSPYSNTVGTAAEDIEKAVINPTWALAKQIALLALLLIVPFVVWLTVRMIDRLVREQRGRQLVVEKLTNSSGKADLETMLPGLSQWARETLAHVLNHVVLQMMWYGEGSEGGGGGAAPQNKSERRKHQLSLLSLAGTAEDTARLRRYDGLPSQMIPQKGESKKLSTFLESLKDIGPDPFKGVLQLIRVVVQPRGTKVVSTLQRVGDTPGKLGISFAIADMRAPEVYERKTIWEQRDESGTSETATTMTLERVPVDAQAAVKKDGSPEVSNEARGLYEVGKLYEERGDLEQAKAKYEAALEKEPAYDAARDALKRVLKSQRTLTERYHALLEPAIYWLAVELSKRETQACPARIPSEEWKTRTRSGRIPPEELERRRYQAGLHILFARLYQLGGEMFSDYKDFFDVLVNDEFWKADDWLLGDPQYHNKWSHEILSGLRPVYEE